MDNVKLPKTKRGEITLKKICEAAEELFSEGGYYETEVNDITRRAGVASGTFYIYFQSKQAVFLHLLDELGKELRYEIRMSKENRAPVSFVELERISIRTFFNFVEKHFGLFRIVWQAQFVDPEKFKQYYERFSGGYIKEIKRAQETGEIKDFDPTLISYLLMGIHTFVTLKCYVYEDEKPDEKVIDQVVDFIANGILK